MAKTKKTEKKKIKRSKAVKPKLYFEAVGRRKSSMARVRLFDGGDKLFLINNKPFDVYFPTLELRQTAKSPLEKTDYLNKLTVSAVVRGGGSHSQAGAVRHGLARTLVLFNPDFRKLLKRAGFLKRDPRMRERKKFGLKRARRAPQWAKR